MDDDTLNKMKEMTNGPDLTSYVYYKEEEKSLVSLLKGDAVTKSKPHEEQLLLAPIMLDHYENLVRKLTKSRTNYQNSPILEFIEGRVSHYKGIVAELEELLS